MVLISNSSNVLGVKLASITNSTDDEFTESNSVNYKFKTLASTH